MKWIWTYPVVCVYGPAGWELLLGEVCKSRGIVAKSNNGLVSVTCCSGISYKCLYEDQENGLQAETSLTNLKYNKMSF